MVLPGHLGGAYLVTEVLLPLTNAAALLSPTQLSALVIIGTLAGEFPDIDLIRFYFEGKKPQPETTDHRQYFTHAPLFWLFIAGIIWAIGLLSQSNFTEYLGLFILGGAWSHLLLDSIEYGVMWLWPLSHRQFALLGNPPPDKPQPLSNGSMPATGSLISHWQFVKNTYLRTWTFWAELLVTLAALCIFIRQYFLQ